MADLRALQSASSKRKRAGGGGDGSGGGGGGDGESFMTREQLMELRKVQAERVEAGKMKLLGMEIKTSMGIRMDGSVFE